MKNLKLINKNLTFIYTNVLVAVPMAFQIFVYKRQSPVENSDHKYLDTDVLGISSNTHKTDDSL